MLVELMGNSPAVAYLAVRARKKGFFVKWYQTGQPEALRPIRLRHYQIKNLRSLWREYKDVREWLELPELRFWGALEGERSRTIESYLSLDWAHPDQWVGAEILMNGLSEIALRLGVEIQSVSRFEAPRISDEAFCVIDVNVAETLFWPETLRTQNQGEKIFISSYWLKKGWTSSFELRYGSFLGTHILLEPHPEQGCVVSLASHSKVFIAQTEQEFLNPHGKYFKTLRALWLMNQQVQAQHQLVTMGPARLRVPTAFLMGQSLGQLPPLTGLQHVLSFDQAERLVGALENGMKTASVPRMQEYARWNTTEDAYFGTQFKKANLFEALLWHRRYGKLVQSATKLLPGPARQFFMSSV